MPCYDQGADFMVIATPSWWTCGSVAYYSTGKDVDVGSVHVDASESHLLHLLGIHRRHLRRSHESVIQ